MKIISWAVAGIVAASAALAQEMVVSQSAWGGGQGVNGSVAALAVQADGKIVIGGRFESVNGSPRSNIARLNPDGTLDQEFANSVIAGTNGPVAALAVRPDGSIVAGGTFTQAGGQNVQNVTLYKPDGTVDSAFASSGSIGASGPVYAVAVQSDGKTVIGGRFAQVCGKQRVNLARINADGTLDDQPFPPQGQIEGPVRAIVATGTASAVAGGEFNVQAQAAQSLYKLPIAAAARQSGGETP